MQPTSWFEALFKFSRLRYAEGEIGFLFEWGPWTILAVLVLAGAAALIIWGGIRSFRKQQARWVSMGLRLAVLGLLAIPLLEPVLIVPDVVPDENFVAVLVDASASMTIPDGAEAQARFEEAQHAVTNEQDGLIQGIDPFFQLRYYTFGERVNRVDSVGQAMADEEGTNLSMALDRVLNDYRGVPLAGVVMLTDGGDNSQDVALNPAEQLRARGIPLYVVGVGQESFSQDREILSVSAGKSVEVTAGAEIDVKVRSWGLETEPATFDLFLGEEQVFSESRMLKGDGKIDQFTFFYEPDEEGAREFTLMVNQASNEQNIANNAFPLLIDSRQDSIPVLYLEGRPRQEFKFIKRSLEDDQVVNIVSAVRTGTSQFFSMGLTAEDDLKNGFPKDRSALYRYRAVILGDIEAPHFTLEQLNLLEEFVRVRGGGFMMLGGRSTFAEGDYANTSIADLLPLSIDQSRRMVIPDDFSDENKDPDERGFRFVPTAIGLENPIMKLALDVDANQREWGNMPGLTSINYLGRVKPGAVILAEKPDDEFGPAEPLLAVQRYGRGRSVAFPTASSWRWQMHLEAEDARHERFWRQLVRWLIASAPDRVDLDVEGQRVAPGAEVPLTVRVFDPDFLAEENAEVVGFVRDPFGQLEQIELQEDLANDGVYEASYVPSAEGVYEISASARMGEDWQDSRSQHILVRTASREFYDATLKRDQMVRLAEAGGGRYFDASEAGVIPDLLRTRRTSTSIFHAEYLWDMPALWLLIITLFAAEWIYRRRQGLA